LRKLISAFTLLAFAGTLLAQSPFVGTWKLDTAKTKYTRGEPPKDLTLVIEEQGDNLQLTGTGTNADGSPLSTKFTVPVKGGDGQVQKGPYDAITEKVIKPNVREATWSKDGKVVITRRGVVSQDGKTFRSTVKGVNPAGKPFAGTEVFEKR
jgi:hypothetical protein